MVEELVIASGGIPPEPEELKLGLDAGVPVLASHQNNLLEDKSLTNQLALKTSTLK